ncbi:MAG: hypothetical protein AAF415_15080 [Pseudomonadota bacterium]
MSYSFAPVRAAATAFTIATFASTALAEPLESANGFVSFSPGGTFSRTDGFSRKSANVAGKASLSVIIENGIGLQLDMAGGSLFNNGNGSDEFVTGPGISSSAATGAPSASLPRGQRCRRR